MYPVLKLAAMRRVLIFFGSINGAINRRQENTPDCAQYDHLKVGRNGNIFYTDFILYQFYFTPNFLHFLHQEFFFFLHQFFTPLLTLIFCLFYSNSLLFLHQNIAFFHQYFVFFTPIFCFVHQYFVFRPIFCFCYTTFFISLFHSNIFVFTPIFF